MPQYTPERQTIGNLLSTTNPPIRVPDWQRNYSWTTSEIEVFWKDLLRFSARYPDDNVAGHEYFLGSVVLVDLNTWHLLLDGQQRMATSAILLSTIRDFLAPYNQNAAVRTSSKYLQDFDDAAQQQIDKLTLNQYDRDFFRREVLETRGAQYVAPIPTLESHRFIRKGRDFFAARFTARRDELNNPQQFNNWILRVQKILTHHMSVVSIVSEDADNAALVFETLNDRGIGLSTPDLLRNLILRRANEDVREEIASLWGEVLEADSDVKLKTFLRHFWISRKGDVKAQSLYREIKDSVEDENIDSLVFSRQLRDASIIYRDILSASLDDADLNLTLRDIVAVGATPAYPALLAAAEVIEDRAALRPLARALLVAYVRHTVVGRLENTVLEDTFYTTAEALRANGDIAAAVATLRAFAPTDEAFLAAFRTVAIAERSVARYVLRELEHAQRTTEELDVALPPRVHVEHIYPQTPRAGERWENHLGCVNRLGNLTLLSRRLNTGIKNAPFGEKKPSYAQSELLLTNSLCEFDNWSPETLSQRQNDLADSAAAIWTFPE